MEELARRICFECEKHTETDPIAIFNAVAKLGFVHMHGPEHHVLDGACILVACRNAGMDLDLDEGFDWMIRQGLKMPGAACGNWGVCGASTSIGAALSFIDGTGPLSTDGTWGKHMKFTSAAIARMADVNGPRCCKRDGYIAMETAIDFINANYGVTLTKSPITCTFYPMNKQCIGERCPYRK